MAGYTVDQAGAVGAGAVNFGNSNYYVTVNQRVRYPQDTGDGEDESGLHVLLRGSSRRLPNQTHSQILDVFEDLSARQRITFTYYGFRIMPQAPLPEPRYSWRDPGVCSIHLVVPSQGDDASAEALDVVTDRFYRSGFIFNLEVPEASDLAVLPTTHIIISISPDPSSHTAKQLKSIRKYIDKLEPNLKTLNTETGTGPKALALYYPLRYDLTLNDAVYGHDRTWFAEASTVIRTNGLFGWRHFRNLIDFAVRSGIRAFNDIAYVTITPSVLFSFGQDVRGAGEFDTGVIVPTSLNQMFVERSLPEMSNIFDVQVVSFLRYCKKCRTRTPYEAAPEAKQNTKLKCMICLKYIS